VQTCLSRALEKQWQWRPGTDLKAWLLTILHNLHVSDLRRSNRERRKVEAALSTACIAPAPDARLDLLDLDRAISELPENQRRVVLLIGVEELSYEEAAGILGVPVGTVRSRLGRARGSLRRRLFRPAALQYDGRSAWRRRQALVAAMARA
jgi:RNA polymerase sigma-70 factor, ECF subfamily